MNSVLPTIISILHLSLIVFMVVAPFMNTPAVLLLHVLSSLCLITHWACNNSMCSLTILESYLRGQKPSETFIYKIVNPVYNISQYKLNKIIWFFTIVALGISSYKLSSIIFEELNSGKPFNFKKFIQLNYTEKV